MGDGEAIKPTRLAVIGWREWIALPELGISRLKVKVDTGARTSALHAFNIHYFARQGRLWARFDVHPLQRDSKTIAQCEAPLIDERYVTDSGGRRTLRPVVETQIAIGATLHTVELTLITRDSMGFRMLLGRQAIRGRFLVDPGRSFLAENPMLILQKKKRRKKTRVGKKRRETRVGS